ncbi:MAG: redox-sensitive bicupin YhaK (pirin superfamily) [Saprospiraceae bacterium]
MDDIQFKQVPPTQNVPDVGLSLLLQQEIFKFKDTAPACQQGIVPHPHRGCSPVPIAAQGEMADQDNPGNDYITSVKNRQIRLTCDE